MNHGVLVALLLVVWIATPLVVGWSLRRGSISERVGAITLLGIAPVSVRAYGIIQAASPVMILMTTLVMALPAAVLYRPLLTFIGGPPATRLTALVRFHAPNEAAGILRVSSSTVMHLIHAGKLPATRVSDRVYRISVAALERYAEGRANARFEVTVRRVHRIVPIGEPIRVPSETELVER